MGSATAGTLFSFSVSTLNAITHRTSPIQSVELFVEILQYSLHIVEIPEVHAFGKSGKGKTGPYG